MKKERLFVAALAAFAFFACSDDNEKSSGNEGCIVKIAGIDPYTCVEENQSFSKQSCVAPNEWVSSCPSGGTTCEQNTGGFTIVTHYYNYPAEAIPCDTRSSSSLGSSSNPSSGSVSGSGGVCYLTNVVPGTDAAICLEDDYITNSDCLEIGEENGFTSAFRSSCPSGHKLKCEEEEEITYYYGAAFANLTCEDMY